MSGIGPFARVAVLPVLLWLGACAASGDGHSPAMSAKTAGLGSGHAGDAEDPQVAVSASAALSRRALPDIPSPKALVGLKQEDVRGLLGDPSFTRTEANSQVWQYAVRTCVLHLFLYEKDDDLSVVYVAASRPSRTDEKKPLSIESCLEWQVIEAQTPAAAG